MNNPSETKNVGPSTLGKRKAAESEGGSSVAKMRATKNRRLLSASKRKGKKGRKARHVKVCNDDTKNRIERAMSQPLYLIDHKEVDPTNREYTVLGPTGLVYTTVISKTLSCSCPDFKSGFHCKHIDTKNRIERAMSQPLYLIDHKEVDPTNREYTVLGPTGLVYTTVISKTLSCSCPDFKSGFHCKHILFVLLRILKVDQNSDLIYQKALVGRELKSIFANSPNINLPSERDVRQLKALASKNQYNRKSIEGDCQVCCEALANQKILIWCEKCGINIHQECFNEWEESLPVDQAVTCVYCRANWEYSYLEY
ncbi:hypothetical protein Glove_232g124 [Diversispora epigaea]|uniref:SWIM-type domain-containing protein n=1 Tax=Diversispora epigaea TaxID=1348612 RepID=A0A397IBN9_9GLOM|nr:hypothetical protein Glove_232g124 [Diversispora epigaea]